MPRNPLLTLFFLFLFSPAVFATTWGCTRAFPSVMGNDFKIPPVNITLNASTPDNTLLYTIKHVTPGVQKVYNCKSSDMLWHLALQNAGTPVYQGTVGGVSVSIYPTNISGLGISINDADAGGATNGKPVNQYPNDINKNVADSDIVAMGMWLDIRLWKIAGSVPLNPGSITFIGPTINQGIVSKNSTDTFSDTTMSPSPGKWFTGNYSRITGSINLINSTCNLQGGDKTVQMGVFNGSSSQTMGKSSWKDASFNIVCPNAYGYGGQNGNGTWSSTTGIGDYGTVTAANSVKNNPITIRIIPRTAIVSQNWLGAPLAGTIALDGSGAQGYGVQLSWGDAATLGSGEPARPVIFNTPITANSLNSSAFRAGAYDIGSSAIASGQDGTIKMAARFIRTTGNVSPGPAKTAIEVIIGYD